MAAGVCLGLVVAQASCSLVSGPQIDPEPARAADIGGRAKQALVRTESVDAAAIRVEVLEQTIVLSGFVETADEGATAERVVSETFPDLTIENRLEVQ